jgi:hypothetical protein
VPKTDGGFWDDSSEQYANFQDAWQAYVSHDYGEVGIPVHKLGSNDGWLVTEAECRGALAAWRQYVDDTLRSWEQSGDEDEKDESDVAAEMDAQEPEYWLRWINFLAVAAVNGGFRVW